MTNRIIYITVVILHFSVFLASVNLTSTGWDQAEVNKLEQKTFEEDDELAISEAEVDEQWMDEIKTELYDTIEPTLNGITISDYN